MTGGRVGERRACQLVAWIKQGASSQITINEVKQWLRKSIVTIASSVLDAS